ncbi:TonB-dependent receptor [uncultured Massilia sp.]|uniref:TonB-dependent receptor n=1 Tax=uncultured Massilia sp. TaxID=169973 RepID=UPI0025F85C4A|nr:TonB-dependent receptor [uncultured Massilia sp.]
MKDRRVRTNPKLLALAVAGIVAGSAQAQSTGDGIQEVMVTAQRMTTPESKTPVALSVLQGEQLERAGLDTPGALGQRLPNTFIENAFDGLRVTIRGISSADNTDKGDPSAAFMVDGIYLARPQSQNVTFYDVERVEVLRGPQGTLYGRNTTAGVINVISKAPERRFDAGFDVTAGDHGARQAGAMVNVPVNDVLALRAAATWNEHDPYLRNGPGVTRRLGLDRDDRAARLAAKLALGRDADLLVRYETSRDDTNNDSTVPDANFYDGIASGKPVWKDAATRDVLTYRFIAPNVAQQQGYSHKKTDALSSELNWNLGPATLSWLGAHRDYEHQYRYNFYYRVAPAIAIGANQDFDAHYVQDSHELRIATRGAGPLQAQAGVYWFREKTSARYDFSGLEAVGLTPHYVFVNDPTVSRSKAVFGQATYALLPRLRATAGARYTEDDKTRRGYIGYQQTPVFDPATDPRELNASAISTSKTTWRLGLDYDLAPATLLYGAVATGYKSGGFNDGCVAGAVVDGIACPDASAVPAATLVYQPETVRAYEGGLKTRFWNNRASLNLAAFHYDYRNLQLSAETVVNGKPRFDTSNAGQASVRGLEAEGQVLLSAADRLTYAAGLLDAHYTRYAPDGVHSWAGVKLDRTPTRTLTLGYEHRFRLSGGSLVAGAATRASSGYLLSVPTQQLMFRVPGHTESDLRLGWEPDGARWSVVARVRNLEDDVRPVSINASGLAAPSAPRTADVRFDYRY